MTDPNYRVATLSTVYDLTQKKTSFFCSDENIKRHLSLFHNYQTLHIFLVAKLL